MGDQPEFVGTAEIEEMFGVPKHRVIRFMRRKLWPDVIAPLKCGLVFKTASVRAAVERLKATGKL